MEQDQHLEPQTEGTPHNEEPMQSPAEVEAQPAPVSEPAPVSSPEPAPEAAPPPSEPPSAEPAAVPASASTRLQRRFKAGKVSLVIAAVVAIVFLLLLLQGGSTAELRFLWLDWYTNVSVILLVGFLAGVALTLLVLAALRLGRLVLSYTTNEDEEES